MPQLLVKQAMVGGPSENATWIVFVFREITWFCYTLHENLKDAGIPNNLDSVEKNVTHFESM